jgi:hypothetical protein
MTPTIGQLSPVHALGPRRPHRVGVATAIPTTATSLHDQFIHTRPASPDWWHQALLFRPVPGPNA